MAFCVGLALANVSLALPLHMLAEGKSPALAGALLAVITASTAIGAAFSPPLRGRLGDARKLLVLALAFVAVGPLVLTASGGMPYLAVGASFVGLGIGMFWVASQILLGALSGSHGSETGFQHHYALFTAGTVVGSVSTGLLASLLQHAGLSRATSLQMVMGLALLAAVIGMYVWRPEKTPRQQPRPSAPTLGLRLIVRGVNAQFSDLLLVAVLAIYGQLVPIVLTGTFDVSAEAIGIVMAGVGAAKITGTYLARGLLSVWGRGPTIIGMIGTGSILCLLVTLVASTWAFLMLVITAELVLAGAWPLLVDACQARVVVSERAAFTAAWNIREYGVIALTTASAGWLYSQSHALAPMFGLGGVLLIGAMVATAAMMRRPVYAPACS